MCDTDEQRPNALVEWKSLYEISSLGLCVDGEEFFPQNDKVFTRFLLTILSLHDIQMMELCLKYSQK